MGMFDEIVLEKSYKCLQCKRTINTIQTKHFDNTMALFYIGDVVNLKTDQAIFQEDVFCNKCVNNFAQVNIIVKHGILIGTKESYEESEKLLADFDRLDLVNYYHKAANANREKRRQLRYYNNQLDRIIEWYGRSKAEIAKDELLSTPLLRLLDDGIRNKDIITALKEFRKELNK